MLRKKHKKEREEKFTAHSPPHDDEEAEEEVQEDIDLNMDMDMDMNMDMDDTGEGEEEEEAHQDDHSLVFGGQEHRKPSTGTGTKKKHFGSFKTMGLSSELSRGIHKLGYNIPTPIQRKTIPMILSGQDVVAMARTGSGKTACFLIPMIERLKCHSPKVGVRAILLSPTRELAMQTLKFTKSLGKFTDLRSCLLLGGDSMEAQFADLATNPDILIATPGRLMHHLMEVGLSLRAVEYIVFDEADRLFEMGFAEQLKEIIGRLPDARQTLLFSATLPQQLVEFARAGLNNPQLVRLDTETKISDTLKKKKLQLYSTYLNILSHRTNKLSFLLLHAGFASVTIYGTMDQTARKINIGKFKNGTTKILIVTDVAARGIDVPLLDNVINYDFPPTAKLFVHRVGRAGRMGRTGTAFSLVASDELPYMIDIHLFLGKQLQDTVPPGGSAYTDSMYGRIPQDALDVESEFVKVQLKLHIELENQFNVTQNAYKLYYKTRAKPSGESVKRAKELQSKNIHPLIEQEKESFIQGLKQFRPPQTVFEIDKDASKPSAAVMSAKRHSHSKLIEKSRQGNQSLLKDMPVMDDELTEIPKRPRESQSEEEPRKKPKNFRDDDYYMKPLPDNHYQEKALKIGDTGINSNDISFEIGGDDAQSINQKQLVRKWDRKKKKFVMIEKGVDVNNKKMRIKNESGKSVKPEDRGKLYQTWKDKNHASIPKVGEMEDAKAASKYQENQARWYQRYPTMPSKKDTQSERKPNEKHQLRRPEQIQKERKKEKLKQSMSSKKKSHAPAKSSSKNSKKPRKGLFKK